MRGVLRCAAAACTAVIAVGCSADTNRPTAEIVDSAGTRIVTYDLTNVAVPIYRVLADNDLAIGEQDGAPEYTFSRIVDLSISADARSWCQTRWRWNSA
jgi:hypothetical protein